MRNDVAYRACLLLLMMFSSISSAILFPKTVEAAGAFPVQSITTEQMQTKYHASAVIGTATTSKIRILIVPGHQPDLGGTVFGTLYERDVVVDIADALAALLSHNPKYEVMVARTKTEWNSILQSYFDTHALEIDAFRKSQALQMAYHLADGSFILEDDQVYHNSTPSTAALQLYGINKWTSDNGYDITLHLHLNDYSRRYTKFAGKYDGFALYVPDHQYPNAAVSKTLGEALASRLNAYHATSTLPKESAGVIEDQQLIAIGTNGSANNASLLIEYGYIYESQFQQSSVRPVAIAEYAYQTYLGLQDFFKDPILTTHGSVSFPYDWTKVTGVKGQRGPGIYALQAALHTLGYYPPIGKSFSDCPVNGVAKACTRSAIMQYQLAKGFEATGTLGPKTRAALTRDATPISTSLLSAR